MQNWSNIEEWRGLVETPVQGLNTVRGGLETEIKNPSQGKAHTEGKKGSTTQSKLQHGVGTGLYAG